MKQNTQKTKEVMKKDTHLTVDIKKTKLKQTMIKIKERKFQESMREIDDQKKRDEALDRVNKGIFFSNMLYDFLKDYKKPASNIVKQIQNRFVYVNNKDDTQQNIEIKTKG